MALFLMIPADIAALCGASEEDAAAFQFIQQITHDIDIVWRNNKCAGCHVLIWLLFAYATPERKSISLRAISLLVDSKFSTTVRLAFR